MTVTYSSSNTLHINETVIQFLCGKCTKLHCMLFWQNTITAVTNTLRESYPRDKAVLLSENLGQVANQNL